MHDIASRHKLAAVIRQHRPDWLFVPYPIDAHPDHVAVTRIAEDARFDAKLTKTDIPGEPWYPKRIIYYFCTHLRMNFTPNFCIDISDTIDQKIEAVRAATNRSSSATAATCRRWCKTINGYFGSRIGTAHAEPFFTHEMLGFRRVGSADLTTPSCSFCRVRTAEHFSYTRAIASPAGFISGPAIGTISNRASTSGIRQSPNHKIRQPHATANSPNGCFSAVFIPSRRAPTISSSPGPQRTSRLARPHGRSSHH